MQAIRSQKTPAPNPDRLYYMDSVRALMMMLILPVHVANIYAFGPDWFVRANEQSHMLTGLTAFLGMFSMPGFFIIAGYLTHMILRKRSVDAWAAGRIVRLGIPTLVGAAVLSPFAILAGTLVAQDGGTGALEAGFTTDFAANLAVVGRRWIGHLWFLPTMMIYAILFWALIRLRWLHPLVDGLNRGILALRHPLLVWLGVLGICLIWRVGVTGGFYVLEREYGFELPLRGIIDLRSWLLFLPFYLVGYMIGRSSDLFEHMMRITPIRVGLVAIGALTYVSVYGAMSFEAQLAKVFMRGILAIGMTFVVLALARLYFADKSRLVQRLTESSYCIYLFHYPLVVMAAVWFRDVSLPPIVEFLIITPAVFVISYVLARITLRVEILAFAFNGIPFAQTRKLNARRREPSPYRASPTRTA